MSSKKSLIKLNILLLVFALLFTFIALPSYAQPSQSYATSNKKNKKTRSKSKYRYKYQNDDDSSTSVKTSIKSEKLESKSKLLNTSNLLSSSIKSGESPLKFMMSFSAVTDVVAPNEGSPSRLMKYSFSPTYQFSNDFKLAAFLEGAVNANTNHGEVGIGSLLLIKSAYNFGNVLNVAPAFRLVVPVNQTQTDKQSFLYSPGVRFYLSSGSDMFWTSRLSFNSMITLSKGYYEYKTEYNMDPNADLKFNPNVVYDQRYSLTMELVSIVSFTLLFKNVVIWDYNDNFVNNYTLSESINFAVNKNMSVSIGMTNDDSLYDADKKVNIKAYDTIPGKTTYSIGTSLVF